MADGITKEPGYRQYWYYYLSDRTPQNVNNYRDARNLPNFPPQLPD